MYTGRSGMISSSSCRVETILYLRPRPSTHSAVLLAFEKSSKIFFKSSLVFTCCNCALPIQMDPQSRWTWVSMKPGVRVRSCPLMTRVFSLRYASAPLLSPTKTIRLTLMATASACGFDSLLVNILALVMMVSADWDTVLSYCGDFGSLSEYVLVTDCRKDFQSPLDVNIHRLSSVVKHKKCAETLISLWGVQNERHGTL